MSGSDFPMSAERGCGASAKEGARDTFGEAARETEFIPVTVELAALLREDWSNPVQIKVENGYMICRRPT